MNVVSHCWTIQALSFDETHLALPVELDPTENFPLESMDSLVTTSH